MRSLTRLSFYLEGKKEKDPNDSLNKSQDESKDGKPENEEGGKGGGLFSRVSRFCSHDQHDYR